MDLLAKISISSIYINAALCESIIADRVPCVILVETNTRKRNSHVNPL